MDVSLTIPASIIAGILAVLLVDFMRRDRHEKSLTVDNGFVWAVIFCAFLIITGSPRQSRARPLPSAMPIER